MTESRYDGTPVRRIPSKDGKTHTLNISPDDSWPDSDITLWTQSLVNGETGLSIGVQGPEEDGTYTVTGEFATAPVPCTNSAYVQSYLMGILCGYVAATNGLGVVGKKPTNSGFSDLFGGGIFR